MEMKKYVIISFYKAYPPAFGTAYVTYYLAKLLNGKKFLFQISSENRMEMEGDLLIFNFKSDGKTKLKRFVTLIKFSKFIVKKIKKIKPDFIILEGASWSPFIYYIFRKIKSLDENIIYHAHNVDFELRSQNNFLIKFLTRIFEKHLLCTSNLSFCTSKEDQKKILKLYGIKSKILPNGVDVKAYKPDKHIIRRLKKNFDIRGKPIVFFHGLVRYKPNKEAINFLINELIPKLKEMYPGTKLVICGGKLNIKKDFLINPGNVPFQELVNFIQISNICVAPIFSGSGTRIKILEYLASKKPVISTSKGIEGLDLEDNKEIFIANDLEEFLRKIYFILTHEEEVERIVHNGFKKVQEYDWKNIVKDFEKTII